MMIVFWHGVAVSENRRLIDRGRWVSNPEYKAFKESMTWAFKMHPEHFDGPVAVKMRIAVSKSMDAHNLEKPIFDALELAGTINNDKQITNHSMQTIVRRRGEDDRIMVVVSEVKNGCKEKH